MSEDVTEAERDKDKGWRGYECEEKRDEGGRLR